jgi:hypothetical protein
MRKTPLLVPLLLFPALASAQSQPSAGGIHVAGLLANDARDLLRNPALPPEIAAAQAAILLQFAVKLDPSDLSTQRLLAETAKAAGKPEIQRNALRAIISADPGDLVSQVRYIELLAADLQTLEERAGLYRNALGTGTIDPQIRSEIALRLARLSEDRGDAAQAKEYLAQAVKLNDMNVGALRVLARYAAEETGANAAETRLRALSSLLAANPYQPDAWLEAARECQAAGVHDRAAEFMTSAGEQMQMNGIMPAGDFYLDLAMEQAIAGQRSLAYPLVSGLAQLPDAPLEALLVAEFLVQNFPELKAPATLAGTQPADRTAEVRKRLTELAKDATNAAALADAAGADLMIYRKTGGETAGQIEAYAKLVDPEDTTLARLRGWHLYRQGKLADAKAALEKIAKTDPLAQVGLARIHLDSEKRDVESARDLLQRLWDTQPQGLLALQVAVVAAKENIRLTDTPPAKQARGAIGKLTPGLSGMHRQPRDAILISTYLRNPRAAVGEPVMLQIRMTNASDRALPVGPEGMVKTTLGIAATISAVGTTQLGICSLQDTQRTYRLEPRQMLETTVRVDQGKLADLLQQHPDSLFTVTVTAITAPRLIGSEQFSAGVGGMVVASDDFQRGRFPLENAADFQKLNGELATLTGDKLLARIEAAGAVYAERSDEVRGKLVDSLRNLAASSDPLVKISLLRSLPAQPDDSELGKAIGGLAADPDPLVRLAFAVRQSRLLMANKENAGARAALEKLRAGEKDVLVGEWIDVTKRGILATASESSK